MEIASAGLKERLKTEKDFEKDPPTEMPKLKSQTKDGDYIIYEYIIIILYNIFIFFLLYFLIIYNIYNKYN